MGSTIPVTADLPICAGIKRKAQEVGTVDSSNHVSKKPRNENIISSENLPLPKSGKVPTLTMILYFKNTQEAVTVLLDTGSTVPQISINWALKTTYRCPNAP